MSQDDAHVFCAPEQVADEIDLNLRMVRDVYGAMGFESIEARLATMPEKHMGEEAMWRTTEATLGAALERNGLAYEINPGEARFTDPRSKSTCPTRSSADGSSRRFSSTSTCPSAST